MSPIIGPRGGAESSAGTTGLHTFVIWRETAILTLLLIWGLFLRLPFFFPPTIDDDESTFTIVGQGILDGLLPYDALWENKPPLVFLFFAVTISLLGKTIIAIRFGSYLWLTAAAYLTYKSAYVLTSERRGSILAAILLITASSQRSPGVTSELLALIPLIGALFMLLRSQRTNEICFFVGALMGTAAMFRTNLSFLSVFVGLFLVLYPPKVSIRQLITRGSAYALGGILIVFVTAIPYLMQHRLGLWFTSVFSIPLNYSAHLRSLANLERLLLIGFGFNSESINFSGFSMHTFLSSCVLWLGGLIGLFICFRSWEDLSPITRNQVFVLLIFLVGSACSVFLSGPAHDHYLIQLYPSLAIFLAVALVRQPAGMQRLFIQTGVFLFMIASSVIFVSKEYLQLTRRIEENMGLSYYPEYEIARYLQHENPDRNPVFLLSDHIVYWFIGQYPPTRLSTHPPNITKQYLVAAVEGPDATPEVELNKILSTRPAFIVKNKDLWYLTEGEPITRLLTRTLKSNYFLANVINGREIYRFKGVSGANRGSEANN